MAQPRCYNQISQEERDAIAALYAQRVSLSEIARQLKTEQEHDLSGNIQEQSSDPASLWSCRAHNKAKERKHKRGMPPIKECTHSQLCQKTSAHGVDTRTDRRKIADQVSRT